MAIEKANAIYREETHACVIAGDTVVALGDSILGKPSSAENAEAMLIGLSGQTHRVLTGWAVIGRSGQRLSGVAQSEVCFNELSADEIAEYVESGEPMDKAGAYGIQGEGGRLVRSYTGDYSTIVGLPLHDVFGALVQLREVSMTDVAQRLAAIRGRVAVAAKQSLRSADTIEIIAASKGQSLDRIRQLVSVGVTSFGESYVPEYLAKQAVFGLESRIHFIGHLQRNKVRKLIPGVVSVQTVDTIRLGEEISKRARSANLEMPVLIQVNLGSEQTKSGCMVDEVEPLLAALRGMDGLLPVGLMAIPPRGGLAVTRMWFRTLASLRNRLATKESPLDQLSMGMSSDFDAAIIEGATMIRLGTLLCGPRS